MFGKVNFIISQNITTIKCKYFNVLKYRKDKHSKKKKK